MSHIGLQGSNQYAKPRTNEKNYFPNCGAGEKTDLAVGLSVAELYDSAYL